MKTWISRIAAGLTLGALAVGNPAVAGTPTDLLARYESEARVGDARFTGFSAARGGAFFKATHVNDWSCATCHGSNPSAAGSHVKTGKPIAPLASAQRFTDPAQTEKWFRRNCADVLNRACTAQEKGDVLAWLLTALK